MKKIILILIAVALITPSVTFASWWNPFSWSFFHKKEASSQIIPSINSSPVSNSVPVEKTEKNPFLEILQKDNSSSSTTIIPTVKSLNLKKNTVDKDYHDLLGNLYFNKIAFLDKQISIFNLFTGNDPTIEQKQADISFHKDWLEKYGKLALDKSAIDLNLKTYEAIVFWNQEIDIRKNILEIYKYRVNDLESIKTRLNEELATIANTNFIPEAEYKLRSNTLNELINEEKFTEQYAEQDKNINDLLDKYNKIDADYSTILRTMTVKTKDENDRSLSRIKAELESLKNTPVPTIPVRSTFQSQPTSIYCEKRYKKSGYPSTTCIESPSMKSMTCDTNYDAYRNESKYCYSH